MERERGDTWTLVGPTELLVPPHTHCALLNRSQSLQTSIGSQERPLRASVCGLLRDRCLPVEVCDSRKKPPRAGGGPRARPPEGPQEAPGSKNLPMSSK